MAKNYNVKEMAEAFKNHDEAAIMDFTARYPLASISINTLIAKAGDAAIDFLTVLPEYVTGLKLNSAFKDRLTNDSSEETTEEEATEEKADSDIKSTKEEKPKKAEKKAEKAEGGIESMRGELIYKRICDLNLKKDFVEKMNTKKFSKPNMVEYITKFNIDISENATPAPAEAKAEKPAKKAEKKVEKAEESDDWGDDDAAPAEDDYSSKTPIELYDICKKKGIKAKTRQNKDYYLELLQPKKEEAPAPEDWDDSEEVAEIEEKPAKKSKKAEKVEKPADDDDDDESWDI